MPEETCVPLNLDMNSCSPKRLCCNEEGAQAYNEVGACPPNQGYTVNSEECACCRPPCTPRDYRVTFTVYRREDNYTRVTLDGEECAYASGFVSGASKTSQLVVSNPSEEVYIEESGLISVGSCGGKVSDGVFGMYILRFDQGCPIEPSDGFTLQSYQGVKRTQDWSIALFYYHTIDLVEQLIDGQWQPV